MLERQRTTVKAVGKHHVRLQGVLEREAGPIAAVRVRLGSGITSRL